MICNVVAGFAVSGNYADGLIVYTVPVYCKIPDFFPNSCGKNVVPRQAAQRQFCVVGGQRKRTTPATVVSLSARMVAVPRPHQTVLGLLDRAPSLA